MRLKAAHVVVRMPKTGRQIACVIAKHEDVIAQHGSVWFGVRGKGLNPKRVSLLLEQIEENIPTYVYIVQGKGPILHKGYRAAFAVFRARIEMLSAELQESQLKHAPDYYARENLFASTWILVRRFEEVQDGILDALHLDVNGNSVVNALVGGMASLMMVRDA